MEHMCGAVANTCKRVGAVMLSNGTSVVLFINCSTAIGEQVPVSLLTANRVTADCAVRTLSETPQNTLVVTNASPTPEPRVLLRRLCAAHGVPCRKGCCNPVPKAAWRS